MSTLELQDVLSSTDIRTSSSSASPQPFPYFSVQPIYIRHHTSSASIPLSLATSSNSASSSNFTSTSTSPAPELNAASDFPSTVRPPLIKRSSSDGQLKKRKNPPSSLGSTKRYDSGKVMSAGFHVRGLEGEIGPRPHTSLFKEEIEAIESNEEGDLGLPTEHCASGGQNTACHSRKRKNSIVARLRTAVRRGRSGSDSERT